MERTAYARDSAEPPGYLNGGYARSLAEFGRPRRLPHSGGWILERAIPGTSREDAMGCYPLFACQNWDRLESDLQDDDLANGLVAISLVTDPFGGYDQELLRRCFPDVVLRFKDHFVADLSLDTETFVSRHHRRMSRRALRHVVVEVCGEREQVLDEWVALYGDLVRTRRIRGIARFSRASFEQQLAVPGMVVLRAVDRGRVIGMTLWYLHSEVAYYHLGAYSERGYELQASYALLWHAFEELRSRGTRWLDLGGAAGLERRPDDGLARFKRGWSSEARTAYFCGRIFDRRAYLDLCELRRTGDTTYFPAYRSVELSSQATPAEDLEPAAGRS